MLNRLRTHGTQAPGMPCPECSEPIRVDPYGLLAGAPIICASCGLELRVNLQESAETLEVLAAKLDSIAIFHSDLSETIDAVSSPSHTDRGGRSPGRRTSKRKRKPQPARKRRERK